MSASSPATGAEIKTFTEGLIGGETIDTDVFYALLNAEKNIIEGLRNWEILKKLDSSNAASPSALPLPTDFREPLGLTVGVVPFLQIPFEQKKQFANSACRWYLDMANSVYYILGSITGTVNFFYKYQTDDITSSTNSVFPAGTGFNKMLAYRVASKYYDLDQEEKGLSYRNEWLVAAQIILDNLIDWDVKLQKRAVENGLAFDQDGEVDIGLL